MSDHFTLDVDPEQLRTAAANLSRMGEHLKEKGREARDTPAEIGDQWTGDAATTVKGEMTALAAHMSRFWTDLDTSGAALRSLATDYEDAQTQVDDLNRKWAAAETAYQQAHERADTAFDGAVQAKGPDGKPLNRGLRHEFESSRTYAYGEASETRRTEQYNLEYSFGMMKQWLGQQTRGAGRALVDAAPLAVTAEQVAAWKGDGSYPVRLERAALQTLEMAGDLTERQVEEEQRLLREEAEEEAGEDLADLDDLLDDEPVDPEQVRDALDQIGENADDEYFSEALVRALGPQGMTDLYDRLGRQMPTYYEVEEIWPGLEQLNDVVANGLAQYDDVGLADFVDTFMGDSQGPKRWALISDSEHADGRMNAVATTYFNQIHTTDLSNSSGFDPFTSMFNLAFGGDDMLDQFDANNSAADFADLLSAGTPEQRERLVMELTSIGGSPKMNREEWAVKARLFGETLKAMVDRENPAEVEVLLANMFRPYDMTYQDELIPYVAEALNDPRALAFLVYECRTGGMDADVLTDAMQGIEDQIERRLTRRRHDRLPVRAR